MHIVLFCHSLLSDWNHGNAHFLRGIATELGGRGHVVRVFEPRDAWSAANLVADHGEQALLAMREVYPALDITRYDPATFDAAAALDGADLVLVHEWNTHDLVRRIGQHRRRGRFVLLFHDTHHRCVSNPKEMSRYELDQYDGVLAFGDVIRERYVQRGWASRAWTWHEAADTRVFFPRRSETQDGDVVWIGNWGDEERAGELREFLMEPVRRLRLRATVHGVRYPAAALEELSACGAEYCGWLPNFEVPRVFARHRVTVHVPRAPYVQTLPGIPTIRPFEALACGIPLITAPWNDREGLFTPGTDYLAASDGASMRRHLRDVVHDAALAREIAGHGRQTVLAKHTCAHRVDELLAIHRSLQPESHHLPERTLPA
jgi:spore maturation protein CgeB